MSLTTVAATLSKKLRLSFVVVSLAISIDLIFLNKDQIRGIFK